MATTGHENESINVEGLKSSLQALKNKYIDDLDSRTDVLEEAVGSGGSIDTRIENAINALDSSASQSAGNDGLSLNIIETNGKITSIGGAITANTYAPASDSARITTLENNVGSGSVDIRIDAAKTEIIGGATSSGDTLRKLENRLTPIEAAIGDGGNLDSRIAEAKAEIIGSATTSCDTLGEAEALISAESTRAQAAEANRYTKSETYSKEETDNIISRTPETDIVVLDVPSGSTALSILNNVPSSDRPNKIFRLRNSTNTHYDEYGWTGTTWALLASKDYGIDFTPTPNSSNWLTSGAIYNYIEDLVNTETENYKFALTDKFGNSICLVDSEDKLKVLLDIVADTINGVPTAEIITTDFYKIAWIDNYSNVIFGIDKNDNLVSGIWDLQLKNFNTVEKNFGKDTEIYKRNIEKDGILTNASYYFSGETREKRLQMLVLTDTHTNDQEVYNWIDAGDAFSTVDCLIHLGDMADQVYPGEDNDDLWNNVIQNLSKPTYIAIGNHDVGTNGTIINRCRDDESMYNQFVLPLVNKNYISPGEYIFNKCYYYHDFPKNKIRLIILYPFENPIDIDTTIWTPIEYDSSYDLLEPTDGKVCQAGDKFRMSGYTKYSFEAKKDITLYTTTQYTYLDLNRFDYDHWRLISYDSSAPYATNGGTYSTGDVVNVRGEIKVNDIRYSLQCKSDVTLTKLTENTPKSRGEILYPRYKTYRYKLWFSKNQLDWLCETLDEAGSLGYTSVIACHYNLLGPCETVLDYRFNNPYHGGSYPPYTHLNSSSSSVISDIVDSYQKGNTININVIPDTDIMSKVAIKNSEYYYVDTSNDNLSHPEGYSAPTGSGVTYKFYDDISELATITTSYNFINSGNVVFLAGHSHSDGILHSTKEGYDQTCIAFLAGIVQNTYTKDIMRETYDSKFMDALTSVTIDTIGKKVHLSRIGADITRRVDDDNRLIKKDNEVINF